MKKKVLGLLIAIAIMGMAAFVIVSINRKNGKNGSEGDTDTMNYSPQAFAENQVLIGDALYSGDNALYFGSGRLQYVSLKNMKGGYLCNDPECTHEDSSCSSAFFEGGDMKMVYFYESKMYVMCVGYGGVFVYSADSDGTNKKLVCSYRKLSDAHYESNVEIKDDKAFIAISETIKSGSSTSRGNDLSTTIVLCFDFKTKEIKEIFREKEGYNSQGRINYIQNGKVAFMTTWYTKPENELYDVENDKVLVDNISDYDVGCSYLYDIEKNTIESTQRGFHEVVGVDDKYIYMNGDKFMKTKNNDDRISVFDHDMNWIKTIKLEDNEKTSSCAILKVEGGFLKTDDTNHKITYYDETGKKLKTKSNFDKAVFAEYNGGFLLSHESLFKMLSGYIKKDQIDW